MKAKDVANYNANRPYSGNATADHRIDYVLNMSDEDCVKMYNEVSGKSKKAYRAEYDQKNENMEYTKKESAEALQRIDCNCNDCVYMKRDLKTLNLWKEKDVLDQKNEFDRSKNKSIRDASSILDAKERELSISAARKAVFKPRNRQTIHYGYCSLKGASVTFIPSVCQIDTQSCFVHRSEKK